LRRAALIDALEFGQLHFAVHAEHFPRVVRLRGRHGHAFADGRAHDVREVILALRVIVSEAGQPARERRGRCDHDAGIHLADLALGVGRIAFLDNAGD
jgi:hypothetical protein